MHINLNRGHHRSVLVVGGFLLALVLVLAACGTNAPTTSHPGGTGSTPTPTATQHQANTNGCPDNTVVTTAPAPASVILTNKNTGNTINVNKGEIVEVRLAQGLNWSGPSKLASDVLTLQGPAGYVSSTDKACVWRFLAVGTGTAQISFAGRPICKKNQMCPMYILAMPFTIEVK